MFYNLYLKVHSAQHCAVIKRQLDQLGYKCTHQRWPDDEITNIQTWSDGTYNVYRHPFRCTYRHQINAKQLREKHGRIGSIKSQANQSILAVRSINIFGIPAHLKPDGVIKVVQHEISLANKVVRFFAKGVECLRVLTKRIVKYFK